MPLRTGRSTRGTSAAKVVEPLGSVRRAQQITTYGVGALIAIGEQSFIVSGLDTWKDDPALEIDEPRLVANLHVSALRWPPADEPSSGKGVGVRRFPNWYSCKNCGDLQPYRFFGTTTGSCNVCGSTLIPSRFISACENGHIDDFPYFEWLHKRSESGGGGPHKLTLRSSGESGSLRSIVISCSCGVPDRSMEGALSGNALKTLGIVCKGQRPWLGVDARVIEPDCQATRRAMQRGSSAVWFPVVCSALTIPPYSTRVAEIVADYLDMWLDETDETVERQAKAKRLDRRGVSIEDILRYVNARRQAKERAEQGDDYAEPFFFTDDPLRPDEYRQLRRTTPDIEENRHFACVPPEDADESGPPIGFAQTMLVKRLREVRALTSFTRVEIPGESSTRKAKLSLDKDWLPAIEVIGEGVFLRFDPSRLAAWERMPNVRARADDLRAKHQAHLDHRMSEPPLSPVTPRFVLVHTLAHALINEWSLDAGYPTAALRERLYLKEAVAEDPEGMAGLLIYTATSDSAGSLGGLVAQGEPKRLQRTFEAALDRVSWCSADPLCMESEASGTDSLNLAACHACVLLPEVSCELGNTLLDRALLIGAPDSEGMGYFRH
ncbi:hypothetical protein ABIA31_002083 [Catenulispora sp. MAP5-51]|uniref:DrmB family protein n=1 Tax=Catenulispora sp. MAP5-51 TaxID=3156298 RepID=UPI0035124CB4